MSNPNEGNAFLDDVSYSVCTLMCGYCEAIEDDILECQSTIKTLFFYDVNFNVHILVCKYYKTIENKNPKCQPR
jgi:hypothetical protein